MFGARAGAAAAEFASSAGPAPAAVEAQAADEVRRLERDLLGKGPGTESVSAIRQEMQDTMEEAAGIFRTGPAMTKGLDALRELQGRVGNVGVADTSRSFNTELLAAPETSNDPFTRAELVQTLASASGHNGMAGGQMMDMAADGTELDVHAVTRLQQLKTGALLSAAVEMGAILGKVPEEGRAHLRAYARDIGLAFQIADDLLDHEGDEAKAGKALRKDAGQGKATFVSLMGADQARQQARALSEQAIGHLQGHGEEADILRALARFVVERES